jgi:autotransporter strand-loop-strand O-heptosyltransferase
MKIAQINPGILPIPPNGWGAVEKIIWEYTLLLRKMGHQVDIKYLDEIQKDEYDIVHVHMANLAIELQNKGIPYVFSMHDHHVVWWGKDSGCFKDNLRAIEGSIKSFVHAKFLVNYFGSSKAVYLEHGVNIQEYAFIERKIDKPKLLCLANNGIIGDQGYDRKGFRYAIEAARDLQLPITVAGPKNNQNFFNANQDLLSYGGLTVLYDLDQKSSVDLFSSHDIFMHPSDLEAGHPNLTLLEAASTGMPIVACMEEDMPGMLRIEREIEDVKKKVREVIDAYPLFSKRSRTNAEYHSWEVVTSKMLEHYQDSLSWDMGKKLIETYGSTLIENKTPLPSDEFIVKFGTQPDFVKVNTEIAVPGSGTAVIYKNGEEIKNFFDHGQESRRWSAVTQYEWYDWEIQFKHGSKIVKSFKPDYRGKIVGVTYDEGFDILALLMFRETFECFLVIIGKVPEEKKILFREHKIYFNEDYHGLDFWFSWKILNSWRNDKKSKIPEKTLLYLRSSALGDTIAFVASCQNWATTHDEKPDVAINKDFIKLFDCYPDLKFIDKNSTSFQGYKDVIVSDYHFKGELQHGFQKDLGLPLIKTRPKVHFQPKERPVKAKYICFSTHSTAQAKYWNHPDGWENLCKMLRKINITPVCVDRHETFGIEGHWNPVPKSAVKRIGMNFEDLMNYMHHAELYIGLGSGHSWLAHSLGKKTVMIAGATNGEYEEDNYKLQDCTVCHGCFNKPDLYVFDPGDWLWCPINKGTEKQFECTKVITPEQVFQKITDLL